MNCKYIFQLAFLVILPFIVNGKEEENVDFLVVTIENDTSNDYASAVQTFKQYDIPFNTFTISQNGVRDEEIDEKLYTNIDGNIYPRYNVVIFPNGRVSYNRDPTQNEGNWQSALTYSQWERFYDYSRNYNIRLVFLNEYPSNYTATKVYHEYKGDEAREKYQKKQAIIADENLYEYETINTSNLSTGGIYHFPALIVNDNNGITADPLLYFGENPDFPEKTVAAVSVDNNGAQYAAFFMAFGEWSKDSTALNIIWLNWASNADFKHISGKQTTTEEAIKENSANGYGKYGVLFIVLTTILTIMVIRF